MRLLLKILVLGVLTGALIATGFALGYPIGRNSGFEVGSEWALLQAKLVAREAGVIMPVYLKDGAFHVLLRSEPDNCRRENAKKEAPKQEPENEATGVTFPDPIISPAVAPAAPGPTKAEGDPIPVVPIGPHVGT